MSASLTSASTDVPAGGVDTTPLLTAGSSSSSPSPHSPRQNSGRNPRRRSVGFSRRGPSLRSAARILRRASRRRGVMRDQPFRVREAAAEQIEERQSDWAYSRPIVFLDLLWNTLFMAAAVVVLFISWEETVSVPLRLWIIGYVVQCILHMVCVSVEYNKRRRRITSSHSNPNFMQQIWRSASSVSSSISSGSEEVDLVEYHALEFQDDEDNPSLAKHLESANAMFSFIWWIIGFYWVSSCGPDIVEDAPYLYWMCIAFLAFDVFFVVICVVVASLIGIAVCCCLPCIIAILYAMADQEGATREDIDRLPKFTFRRLGEFDKQNGETQESFGGVMIECESDPPTERVLSSEDAECIICLESYNDGSILRELPCRHHFHGVCIDRWLHINSTCPLCKRSILKNGEHSGLEEV